MGSIFGAYKDPKLPKNFFRVPVLAFRWVGIELIYEEESPAYRIYSMTMMFLVMYMSTLEQSLEMYNQWGDMDRVANVTSYLFTYLSGMVKVTLIYLNRKKIGNMIKMLHQPPFYPDAQRGGPQEEIYVRNVIKTMETQMAVYCAIVYTTIISGGIASLKSRLFSPKNEWQFPFTAITIFDTTGSPLFEIASFCQFVFIFLYAAMIVSSYCLDSSIFAHLSTQMKLVQNAFRTLNSRAKKMAKIHHNEFQGHDYIKRLLKEYINHHLKVLDLADRLEELCNKMVLVVYLSSLILLCFNLYQATWYPIGSLPSIQYCTYSLIIICQVGMYGYWGNEVTLQSTEVGVAAADVDWLGTPPSVPNALIMVMIRSQKQVKLTAGKFVPLSLVCFMSIVKGSFSYFMVLRRKNE